MGQAFVGRRAKTQGAQYPLEYTSNDVGMPNMLSGIFHNQAVLCSLGSNLQDRYAFQVSCDASSSTSTERIIQTQVWLCTSSEKTGQAKRPYLGPKRPHKHVSILKSVISGIPLILGLGTRHEMSDGPLLLWGRASSCCFWQVDVQAGHKPGIYLCNQFSLSLVFSGLG